MSEYEGVEGFIPELKATVRECIGCGCLVAGGPTRCKRCAAEAHEEAPLPTTAAGVAWRGGSLVINGLPFEVQFVDVDALRSASGKDLLAEVDHLKLTIRVANAVAGQIRDRALLHEALHALSEIFQLNLSERQVDCLSHGLHQVMVQNPWFAALFQAGQP